MSWIKKNTEVVVDKELEYSGATGISKTDAYEVEITECRLAEAKDTQSKSVSLVVGVKNEAGETAKSFFTIMGRDGKTYFESTVAGEKVKKQHFGLSIANTLFEIALGKEIFEVEPEEVEFEIYNKESKEREKMEGQGFPELIGKKVGVCIQMVRTIDGKDSYEKAEIEHFFDSETGLFDGEEDSDNRKLDRWMKRAKDFKEIVKEEKKTAFGAKKTDKAESKTDEAPKKKWGK